MTLITRSWPPWPEFSYSLGYIRPHISSVGDHSHVPCAIIDRLPFPGPTSPPSTDVMPPTRHGMLTGVFFFYPNLVCRLASGFRNNLSSGEQR